MSDNQTESPQPTTAPAELAAQTPDTTVAVPAGQSARGRESGLSGVLRNRGVRILIVGLLAVVACFLLANVAVSLLKGARGQPINYEVYPGAELVSSTRTTNADSLLYATSDSVQQVLAFYSSKVPADTDGTKVTGCKPIFIDATPSFDPGHVRGACIIENSLLDVSQNITIQINYQQEASTGKFKTFILVDRVWGKR